MKNRSYESPQIEVVEIELEGLLCESYGVSGANLTDGSDDIFNLLK